MKDTPTGWLRSKRGRNRWSSQNAFGILLSMLFSLFSTWSVIHRFEGESLAFLPEPTSIQWIGIAFLLCFLLYAAWWFFSEKRKPLPALFAALALSLFYAVGAFVRDDLNSLERITVFRFAFRAAGMLPIFYCGISLLFSCVERHSAAGAHIGESAANRKQVRGMVGGILALLWLPYLIGCFPGNMTADTLKSVASFQDPLQGRNIPWLVNLLYGGTLLLGEQLGNANIALFIICLAQTALLLFVLANLFSRLWIQAVPKGLLIFLLLLFGIVPIFPTYAFCTMKDVLFTMGILFFCDAGIGILGAAKPEGKEWLQLGISAVFTSLTRNGAVFMMICCLLGFFFLYRSRRAYLAILAVAMIFGSYGIPGLLRLPGSQIRESLSLPIQQLARVYKQEEEQLSAAELERYGEVMTSKQWKKYKSGISDPVKKYFPENPEAPELRGFFSLWGSEMKAHPYAYLEAAVLLNYAYYVPQADRSDLKGRLFLGTERFSTENREDLPSLTKNENPGLVWIRQFFTWLNSVPLLRLFTRIGIYSWLLVIALIYGISEKRRRKWVLLLIPELIVLIGCCFSPVNGHLRYAFPFMVCGPPISLLVFFGDDQDGRVTK